MHSPASTRRQCTTFLGGRSVKNNGLNISHWSENMYLFGTEPTEAFACSDATALTAGGDYDRLAEKTTEVKRMLTGLVQKLKAVG
jgi:hypothetical protein